MSSSENIVASQKTGAKESQTEVETARDRKSERVCIPTEYNHCLFATGVLLKYAALYERRKRQVSRMDG